MSLFGSTKRSQAVIVMWAPPGVIIPLRCKICGAVFLTRNSKFVGATKIWYGDDYQRSIRCNRVLGHNIRDWMPDYNLYVKGVWK